MLTAASPAPPRPAALQLPLAGGTGCAASHGLMLPRQRWRRRHARVTDAAQRATPHLPDLLHVRRRAGVGECGAHAHPRQDAEQAHEMRDEPALRKRRVQPKCELESDSLLGLQKDVFVHIQALNSNTL